MQDITDIKTGLVNEVTFDNFQRGNCFELIYSGF